MKTAKCVNGERHKWEFVKNVTTSASSMRGMSFTKRGVYKCTKCTSRKFGAVGHEATT